jgi:glycosyltransferase involved in cell wall biosynthesis
MRCLLDDATVLHLSADYPDPLRPPTTVAVKKLIEQLCNRTNIVISLNRTANPLRTYFRDCGATKNGHLYAYRYWGLPFGVGLLFSMWLVSRRIRKALTEAGIRIHIVYAHKLAIEGIAALFIANASNIPLLVSLRGEVEPKIIGYKPSYRFLISRILKRASALFYVSAWLRPFMDARFTIDSRKCHLLPNFVDKAARSPSSHNSGDRFVTVFDFGVHRRKGIKWLLEAFFAAFEKNPEVHLDIIGSGDATATAQVKSLVQRANLTHRVTFIGQLPNQELLSRLGDYVALVLPSVRETFGMVYLEALLAGTPILHTRHTGIDGFLNGLQYGVAVEPGSVRDITKGLIFLREHGQSLRAQILARHEDIKNRFDPDRYV